MSFHKADATIQASKTLTRAQKDVLAYLTSCAATRGYAWPSYEAIMENCAIASRTTVSKALTALETNGYIKKTPGGRKGSKNLSNRYKIIPQAKIVKPKKKVSALQVLMDKAGKEQRETNKKITSLVQTRAMLEKSGAMNEEIGLIIASTIKTLTTK